MGWSPLHDTGVTSNASPTVILGRMESTPRTVKVLPGHGDCHQLDRERGSFPGLPFPNSAFLHLTFGVSSGVCLGHGASTKYYRHLDVWSGEFLPGYRTMLHTRWHI